MSEAELAPTPTQNEVRQRRILMTVESTVPLNAQDFFNEVKKIEASGKISISCAVHPYNHLPLEFNHQPTEEQLNTIQQLFPSHDRRHAIWLYKKLYAWSLQKEPQ